MKKYDHNDFKKIIVIISLDKDHDQPCSQKNCLILYTFP